jgi:hypothetical protein
MSDEPRNPELENLLDLVVDLAIDRMNVSMPGRVVSFDDTNQFASIQPLIKKEHLNEFEELVAQLLPEIHDVPVWFFGAKATGRITVPVGAGDIGVLVFSSMSIARWKLTGGVVDPGKRPPDINDCYFLPGGHTKGAAPTTAPTNAIVLHGPSKIGGPSSTQPTIMANHFLNGPLGTNGLIAILEAIINIVEPSPIGPIHVMFNAWKILPTLKTTNTEVK